MQIELRKLQSSADAGSLSESGRLTVGEHVAHWLEHVARPAVRATTFQRYEQIARLHVIDQLGGVQLSTLRAAHVEQFYGELERAGMSATTRRACGQLLTAALKHAVRRKLIAFNPSTDVPKARIEHKEMKFLTAAQVATLLAAAKGNRLSALFALACGSGMRQGELLALRWGDLDFNAGTVTVARSLAQIKNEFHLKEPKSKASRRTISLPLFTVNALKDHRVAMLAEGNVAAPVFCTRTGNYIAKTNLIRKVFKPVVTKADLPMIRFHDLRHSHASNLLASGYSLKAVSQRLGHANVELTLRVYAHVLPGEDKSLADGLDRMIVG